MVAAPARSDRVWIAYQWRHFKVMFALLVIELPVTIACLVLFGIADGDTYRTKLWQNGYDKGFNSAPNSILYDYANYRPVHVPLVWSHFNTEYNIIISVLGMFLLLTKSVMYMLDVFIPILSVFVHALLIALYCVSVRNQSAPDLSDPQQPSPGLPWYLSKGCSYAFPKNYSYCMMARAAYGCTITMVALYVVCFGWSIYNCVPSAQEKVERLADRDLDIELSTAVFDPDDDKERRRRRKLFADMPKTPVTSVSMRNLVTPRQKALASLNGSGAESAGDPAPIATGVGPSRPLAFREQYGDSRSPTEG